MTRSALGGFVSGLQAGQEHVHRQRRNARLNRLLDYEMDQADMRAQGQRDWLEGEAPGTVVPAMEDPVQSMWSRAYNRIRSMFDRGESDAVPDVQPTAIRGGLQPAGGIQPAGGMQPTSYAADGGYVRKYAEGGEVRRAGYYRDPDTGIEFVNGNPIPGQEDRIAASRTGGGPREFMRDMGRQDAALSERVLPRAMEAARQANLDEAESRRAFDEAATPRERGRATRDILRQAGSSALQVGSAFGQDVLAPAMPLVEGAAGFLGFDGAGDTPAPERSPAAAQPGATRPPGTGGEQTTPAPASAGSGGATPAGAEAPPRQAVQTTPQQQEYVPPPGQLPDDVPTFKTRDWQQYRAKMVEGAIKQGMNPAEAHAMVDQIQMRGFQRYSQMATAALQNGDARGAAIAMKGAYTYFPNGSDVKFGMTRDVSGQPALIAMGMDEETGEQVGTPMVINAERLAVMTENLSNPGAWRNWTKDWRTQKMEDEIFRTYTKPMGEAQAETARLNARTRALEADTAASRGTRGGLKPSDIRSAGQMFQERLGMMAMDEETQADADALADVMGRLYMVTGMPETSVINIVMRAYAGDQEAAQYLRDQGLDLAGE